MIDSKIIFYRLRELWVFIPRTHRRQIFFLGLLIVLTSVAEIISIGAVVPFLGVLMSPELALNFKIIKFLTSYFNLYGYRQITGFLTIAFITAALIAGAFRFILVLVQTRLSNAIGAEISVDIYKKTLYQPYEIHITRNTSEIIATISSKTSNVVNLVILPAVTLVGACFLLVIILCALVLLNPTIALITYTSFALIYGLIILLAKKRLSQYSYQISVNQNKIIKALQEGLGGIRDVLIDGTQEFYLKVYKKADLPLRKAVANLQIVSNSPRYLIEALGMTVIAGVAFFLTQNSEGGGFSSAVPILGALALGAQRVLPMLQQAYSSWSSLQGGQASLEDVLALLKQPIDTQDFVPLEKKLSLRECISIEELSFCYPQSEAKIISNLSLRIKKGSRIGIIGQTGGGKSTLLDLLMGLLHPQAGRILIDEIPIDGSNCANWQKSIAHVPQGIFLADSTIAENIAFGLPIEKINMSKVKEAAKKAQISEVIESWDLKYNTVIGERGVRLSGGQRQRIGIARALYKDADVIIFDEATSALDSETENAVINSIEALGKNLTIIIVAHRLTTLRNCAEIFELSEGKLGPPKKYSELITSSNDKKMSI